MFVERIEDASKLFKKNMFLRNVVCVLYIKTIFFKRIDNHTFSMEIVLRLEIISLRPYSNPVGTPQGFYGMNVDF